MNEKKMVLDSAIIYPVKSCMGIALKKGTPFEVIPTGIRYRGVSDRQYMFAREKKDGTLGFMSQRQIPELCRVEIHLEDDALYMSVPEIGRIKVNYNLPGKIRKAQIHRDTDISVVDLGDDLADWAMALLAKNSKYADLNLRFVSLNHDKDRFCNVQYASGSKTALQDGYPFTLLSVASLMDLNTRLRPSNVQMSASNFRPNFVISGCEAYYEDQIAKLKIGDFELKFAKYCDRCNIPRINPYYVESYPNNEPTRTLEEYRWYAPFQNVILTINCVPSDTEMISENLTVGDEVLVLSEQVAPALTSKPL